MTRFSNPRWTTNSTTQTRDFDLGGQGEKKAVCTEKFTKKEMKHCMRTIKKKAFKSCKEDGIQYWVIVHGGRQANRFLVGIYE